MAETRAYPHAAKAQTSRGPAVRGSRRAITLLEVMVAIALLLALAAIAIPAMFGELAERRFDGAVDAVSAGLLLARAHAQETHGSVEVVYISDEEGAWIEARPFEAGRAASEQSSGESDQEAGLRIAEPWALRALPEGVRIEAGAEDEREAEQDEVTALTGSGAAHPALRLALFVPDGSALLGETFRLLDDEGRGALWTIDIWTGLPKWEEIERTEADP